MKKLPRLDSLRPNPLAGRGASRARVRVRARYPGTLQTFVRIRTGQSGSSPFPQSRVSALTHSRARRSRLHLFSWGTIVMARGFALWLGSAALVSLAASGSALSQTAPAAPAAAATADEEDPPQMLFPGWGADPADLDPSVKPGDDFDTY